MSLHPEIEAIVALARLVPVVGHNTQSVAQRRRDFGDLAISLWKSDTPMAEVHEIVLPLDSAEIPGRLYVPLNDEQCGLLLYFHGGSFIMGDLESHDGLCRRLAADTKMRLLAIEYRLAPEHPFPTAAEDAIGVLRYVSNRMSEFATANSRIIVIGDSAGGTLAAVAAASTRGEGLPIAAQALLYPTLGPELLTHSAHEFGEGYLLNLEQLRYDYQQYLGEWSDHGDSRLSPLMNLDLTQSPPAVIVVAEFDPLRDEAVAYAGLLEHFGTPVELLEAKGMVHGFLQLGEVVPDAMAIVDELARHLHRFVEVTST